MQRNRVQPIRRGIAAAQAIIIAGSVVSLGVGAYFARPALTRAMAPGPAVLQSPTAPGLADACESMRELLGRSREVLGVYGAEGDGVRELLLWGQDTNLDGNMQAGEIILLTFSKSMGVLAAYAGASDSALENDPAFEIVGGIETAGFDPDAIVRPGEVGERLARRLRTTTGIRRTVLAVGLEDVRVERVRESAGEASLRLRVIWPGEGLDSSIEACECAL